MADPALITAWATVAIAGATTAVGAITCYLIWRGINAMEHSSNERAQARIEARDEDLRRHNEAMTALRELIHRTSHTSETRSPT